MNEFPDLKKFSHLSSTFFGVGLLPMAPGTWGSVAALFLFFGLIYVQISFLLYFLLFIFFSIASIIIPGLGFLLLEVEPGKSVQ